MSLMVETHLRQGKPMKIKHNVQKPTQHGPLSRSVRYTNGENQINQELYSIITPTTPTPTPTD